MIVGNLEKGSVGEYITDKDKEDRDTRTDHWL